MASRSLSAAGCLKALLSSPSAAHESSSFGAAHLAGLKRGLLCIGALIVILCAVAGPTLIKEIAAMAWDP
ncbi:MAG: hypothetical protein ACLP8A_17305 [Methylovirgula sp.]